MVGPPDRGKHQDRVDEPLGQPGRGRGQHPGEAVPERILRQPGDPAGQPVEDERGGQVAEAEGGRAEHPAVQRAVPHPPLRQGDPDDRAQRRVDQRQQDRDGQFPDRVHVPGDAGLLPGPPCQLHAAEVAR